MAISEQETRVAGLLARIGKAHFCKTAKSHFARSTLEHEAKRPALRAAATPAQVKTPAISVEARLISALDLECRQSLNFLRQFFLSSVCPPYSQACPQFAFLSSNDRNGQGDRLTRATKVSAQSHKTTHNQLANLDNGSRTTANVIIAANRRYSSVLSDDRG